MNDFNFHPHWEGKVIKDALGNVVKLIAMLGGLWFVGVCYSTYTDAMARYDAMAKVQYAKSMGERHGE